MSDRHVMDELSAYLDGEADHPDRIARHLQHCEDCARRHIELLRLSAHLRALPSPPVRDSFARDVLARLHGEATNVTPWRATKRRWPLRTTSGLAAAAALLLAAAIGLTLVPQEKRPAPAMASVSQPAAPAPTVTRTVELLAQTAGEDTLEFPLAPVEEPNTETVPLADLLDQMALASAMEEPAEPPAADEDLLGLLGGLKEDEIENLQELIQDYGDQG